MFTGSVPQDARLIIYDEIKHIDKSENIFVGCSGNFTIDKIASNVGFKVHSNDVSLYSLAIADIVLNKSSKVTVKDSVLKEVFDTWENNKYKLLIEIMFVMNICKFSGAKNDYQKQMFNSYMEKNGQFYERTLKKFNTKEMFNFKIESFFYGDFKEHIKRADGIVFLFAPTYTGGYEKLYKAIDETFDYEKPTYEIFDSSKAGAYYEDVMKNKRAMIYSDRIFPECEHRITNKIDMGMGKKDIYIYSTLSDKKRYLTQKSKILAKTYDLISADYVFTSETKIDIRICKTELINHYKHFFMSAKVNYSEGGDFGLIFFADGKAFGFCSFSKFLSNLEKIFMQSDFVATSKQKKLSKLLIMLLKSVEVKNIITQNLKHSYKKIKTSVFTDKPVSMKYRGAFKLEQRIEKEKKLIYEAEFTKEKIMEIYPQWLKALELSEKN